MLNALNPPDVSDVIKLKKINLLLVQSNPADGFLTLEAFKAAGLKKGMHLVSGNEAVMYVMRQGRFVNAVRPDLVFLDLSQPRISGLTVLKVIKSTPELMHIPIVVAAGSDNPKFVRVVYQLNANCFIRKPDKLTEFAQFIETCCDFWSGVVTLSRRRAFSQPILGTRTNSQTMAQPPSAGLVGKGLSLPQVRVRIRADATGHLPRAMPDAGLSSRFK